MKKKASDLKVTVVFHDDEEECQRQFQKAVKPIFFQDDTEIKSKQSSNH